ncbi:uroporphyrinogen-III C-methyltransferase [bacterium]|nr:uroporphyrinogen-III C-methyltransferase [bacterium]
MAAKPTDTATSPASVSQPGKVYLVGAGPGDPGLITVRGRECLAEADLVLYDGLVNPLLLRHSHAKAQRTCRMEGPEGRRLDQAEINRQLVEAGLSGLTVVRLKGGDPFIFGRGTEEAAALAAAGIPFEVVPGITAATAAAVYTGISLTHRDHASAVAFVTGHEDPLKAESALDYAALARFPGTLVFYMGLHRLPTIAAKLMAEGKVSTTPTAVVSRATSPLQRTVIAPLECIAKVVAEAGLHAPSLVIVGDCVQVREVAHWFEDRPLFGKKIAITRPDDQADAAIDLAWRMGALPIPLPTIEISPPEDWSAVDAALSRLGEYDWLIFTSVNGVAGLLDRLWDQGGDARKLGHCQIAAIGPGTAAALKTYGLRCDLMPDEFRAEALGAALSSHVATRRVLWARANRGRDVLPRELSAAGAHVDQVVVYQNQDVTAWPDEAVQQLEAGELDWIALSSPSIANQVAQLLPAAAHVHLGRKTRIAAISPVTAEAAKEAGLPVHAVATDYTWPGLLNAIARATSE